jgi:hypothetical protein
MKVVKKWWNESVAAIVGMIAALDSRTESCCSYISDIESFTRELFHCHTDGLH